jgi:hypothetical protein
MFDHSCASNRSLSPAGLLLTSDFTLSDAELAAPAAFLRLTRAQNPGQALVRLRAVRTPR